MNNLKYFFLSICLFFISCTDDDDGPSFAAVFEHRGIFINDFQSILGNTSAENQLLQWCDNHDFNHIYLYNVRQILNDSKGDQLNDFVEKAHNWNGTLNVTFSSSGFGDSFDSIVSYHHKYPNIPRGIVSEIEFWNSNKTYAADMKPWITRVNRMKFTSIIELNSPLNPNIVRRFYIGKIKDSGVPPSLAIAKELVQNHDEILLVNYHTDAFNLSTLEIENSIKNKLRLLAQAGMELNQQVNIIVLFNVKVDSTSPNIWYYFSDGSAPIPSEPPQDQPFENAYIKFKSDFDAATDIPNKSFLNLKGYGIYRYTDAKTARPN